MKQALASLICFIIVAGCAYAPPKAVPNKSGQNVLAPKSDSNTGSRSISPSLESKLIDVTKAYIIENHPDKPELLEQTFQASTGSNFHSVGVFNMKVFHRMENGIEITEPLVGGGLEFLINKDTFKVEYVWAGQ